MIFIILFIFAFFNIHSEELILNEPILNEQIKQKANDTVKTELNINDELRNLLQSSFVMGTAFKSLCKFIYGPPSDFEIVKFEYDIDPSKIKKGDLVFIETTFIHKFFKDIHPRIKNPYVLISHQASSSSPGGVKGFGYGVYIKKDTYNKCIQYLNDKKIIAWFGINQDVEHPKFFPIPLGVRHWYSEKFYENFNRTYLSLRQEPALKKHLVYLNFEIKNAPIYRKEAYDFFKTKNYCFNVLGIRNPNVTENYLRHLAESKFVISPHGYGMDCYRTWEILLMGSYPLVKRSNLDILYKDLPVLILNDWSEATEEFLEAKYLEMSQKTYSYEKLFMPYWVNQIKNVLTGIK